MIFKFHINKYLDKDKNGEYTHDIVELHELDLEELAVKKWMAAGGEIAKLKSVKFQSIDLER